MITTPEGSGGAVRGEAVVAPVRRPSRRVGTEKRGP